MQTSVFGGIIIGFVVQWAYNRFHTIQLPQVISFFGGKRFVAIAVVILMIPLVFTFLLFWPYIGYIFNWIGKNSGKIQYGFDSFIFGFIERSLVPFGLHHVFYSPLWYTSAGGDVSIELKNWLDKSGNEILASDFVDIIKQLKGEINIPDSFLNQYISGAALSGYGFKTGSINGDSSTTLALLGVNTNDIHYKIGGKNYSKPLFMFIQDELGLRLGRFLDGKFSFMQWGLPFAGLAMIMAAPKENRKMALGTILPASLTCFITGVTEPLEFTFLFLAPTLFFGFHAFFCAVSFLMANVLSVHIGMAFSGGFLDLVVYGMIPVLKGTNFWWTIVVGMAYIPIYFFGFYFWIKKADLPTPGRGGNTKLFTKKDYQQSKNGSKNNFDIDPQAIEVINGFGGKDNIIKTANCATRLRFDVKDMNLVNEEKLKSAGAFGIRKTSDTHLQVIFGPVADQLKIKVDHAINEIDKNPEILNQFNSINNSKQKTNIKSKKTIKNLTIYSPANGKLKTLSSLKDGVFSENILGNGFVVESTDGNIYAPVSGKVVAVFPSKHAYGIETKEGLNILIHIGIDTVSLKGEGFDSYVEQGEIVEQGKLIAHVDLNIIKDHNLISDVICVITTDSLIQPNLNKMKLRGNVKSSTIVIS